LDVHLKIECEIVIQQGSEKPEYFIAVIDYTDKKSSLTFFAPDIESIQAGAIKENETKHNKKLFIDEMPSGMILADHNSRIYGIYQNIPASTFLVPTKSWIKSFLSSYAKNKSAIVIEKKDAAKAYEITIKEMTRISNVVTGVLKLYIDTSDLTLKKTSFVGKTNMDKNRDGESDIVRINVNFVKTDIIPEGSNVSKTEKNEYKDYAQVIIK